MSRSRNNDVHAIIKRLTQLMETQVARLANQNGNGTAPQTPGERFQRLNPLIFEGSTSLAVRSFCWIDDLIVCELRSESCKQTVALYCEVLA